MNYSASDYLTVEANRALMGGLFYALIILALIEAGIVWAILRSG